MMETLPEGIVTAEQPGGPSRAFFLYSDQCCHAVVVRVVETGALICIPQGGVDIQHFVDASNEGHLGMLGPYMEGAALAALAGGKVSKRTLSVVLFDLDSAGFSYLSTSIPNGFEEGEVTAFGLHRGNFDLPAQASVLELAAQFLDAAASGDGRLDAYYTAPEDGAPEVANGAGGDSVQDMLQQLLSRSEATQRALEGMEGKVRRLSQLEEGLGRLESPGQARPSTAPANPQLFDRNAGLVPPAAQRRLKDLAGRGPGKLGDLQQNAAPVASSALAGITEVDEEDIDGEPLDPDPPKGSILRQLLASQTAMLAKLTAAKTASADPLNLLSASSSDIDDNYKQGSGVRGIAARQLLSDHFKKNPGKVVQCFRERLSLARRKSTVQELEPRDLWYHFQESVPFGNHRTLTYMGFMAASLFEASERGDHSRVQMLICLMAVFAEQAACDGGALRMAHLLTCLDDPPFAQTELHKTMRAELAHGQLSDPRWVATQLAYLRDLEQIGDKTSKYVKGGKQNEASEENKEAKPKWRPKRGKKQTQDAAEAEG